MHRGSKRMPASNFTKVRKEIIKLTTGIRSAARLLLTDLNVPFALQNRGKFVTQKRIDFAALQITRN